MICAHGECTSLVEERQGLSTDDARGVADRRLAFGVVVFVVSVEILGIDSLAEFGRQIKKAVESVVFVIVLLEFFFEISHCDTRI